MALRQKVSLPGYEWSVKSELEPVRMPRPAREVEFRRGASPASVVQDILPYNHVKLCAPVGSGKSVNIPSALALATKAVVFHVVPSRQLAAHLFAYLVKVSQQPSCHGAAPVDMYRSTSSFEVPRTGVFLVSAVDMVDLMMYHSGLRKFVGCSVFLDEAHESDAYTHTVRALSLQLGAERLVLASATFGPGVHGVRSTPGKVEMKPVELGPYTDWEVDRRGSPFHVASMRDGVLVFVDSRSAASHLAVAYERMGLDVFRLTASSTDAEVSRAMHAAQDKRGGLFAILADYTYRSGFTFPVSRVIDTGAVAYFDSEPGAFRRLTRRMFEFEREQAAGRVGRVDGNAEYYYEAGPCHAVMCDLEGVEREAAAYIFRCFGFRPDFVLAGAFMASAELPRDLSIRAALNGPYPLTYYVKNLRSVVNLPVNEYVPPVVKQAQDERDDSSVARSRVDSVFSGATGSRVETIASSVGTGKWLESMAKGADGRSRLGDESSSCYSAEGGIGGQDGKDRGELLRGAAALDVSGDAGLSQDNREWDDIMSDFASRCEIYEYRDDRYHIPQVRDSQGRGVNASMTFPSGLHSVRAFATKRNFEFAVQALSRDDRKHAFCMLLDRYNIITAQVRGAKAALAAVAKEDKDEGFYERARDVLEDLSADYADAIACLRAAEKFAESTTWATPYEGGLKSEDEAREQYAEQFAKAACTRGALDLEGDVSPGLESRMRMFGDPRASRRLVEDDYGGRQQELLLPDWASRGGRITYSAAPDEPGGKLKLHVMSRDYGHDGGYRSTTVRRYVRVTTRR